MWLDRDNAQSYISCRNAQSSKNCSYPFWSRILTLFPVVGLFVDQHMTNNVYIFSASYKDASVAAQKLLLLRLFRRASAPLSAGCCGLRRPQQKNITIFRFSIAACSGRNRRPQSTAAIEKYVASRAAVAAGAPQLERFYTVPIFHHVQAKLKTL